MVEKEDLIFRTGSFLVQHGQKIALQCMRKDTRKEESV